jgi:hypothetical protein
LFGCFILIPPAAPSWFILRDCAFSLGAAKVLVTRLNPIRSGIEMLVVGGLAAGVAYIVGALLKGLGG